MQIRIEGLGLPAKIVDVELAPNAAITTADVGLTLGFEEQITVGSRMVGAEAQKAVPVDVITQEQIASTGYAETAQVIQAVAPSFNSSPSRTPKNQHPSTWAPTHPRTDDRLCPCLSGP